LVGTEEGNVFGLDAANGDVLWQFQAGTGEIVDSPVVAGDTMYVASVDGTLYAITGGN
jgi:outer membrane protein assembly factor BamB